MKILGVLTLLLTLLVSAAAIASESDRQWPKRSIKIIVPFKPGGSSDQLVRIMQKGIADAALLPKRLTVINKGGHYTVGARKTMYEKPTGYNFMVIHRAIMGAQANDLIDFGFKDYEAVAQTAAFSQVLAVKKDAPWQTLDELLTAAKQKPGDIVFGCNVGAVNHMAGVTIQQLKPGAEFTYVQTGGGAANYGAIKGNHVQLSVFGVAEYISFKEDLRALAYTGAKQHPTIPEVPTLRELGHDVTFTIGSWWFAPKGTPQVAIDGMADALEAAMKTDYVKAQLDTRALDHTFLRDEPLKAQLEADWLQVKEIARHMNIDKQAAAGIGSQSVPVTIGIVLGLLFIMIIVQAVRDRQSGSESVGGSGGDDNAAADNPAAEKPVPFTPQPQKMIIFSILTALYVGLLITGMIGFAYLTACFVLAGMALLLPFSRVTFTVAIILALIIGFGCQYIFTEIFTIDLPTGGAS